MGDVTFNITNINVDSVTLAARVREAIDEGLAPFDDQSHIYDEGVVFANVTIEDIIEHHAFEKSALAQMSYADIHELLLYCRNKDKVIHDSGILDFDQLERIAIEH